MFGKKNVCWTHGRIHYGNVNGQNEMEQTVSANCTKLNGRILKDIHSSSLFFFNHILFSHIRIQTVFVSARLQHNILLDSMVSTI